MFADYHVCLVNKDSQKDNKAVEKVRRHFTKLLSLPSLELRRLHTDLVQCYKIVFGMVDVECDNFFRLCASSVTHGHGY